MNDIAKAITDFFAGGEGASEFLGALALVGVATTALIQAVKETLPVRRWFQSYRLHQWLRRRVQDLPQQERADLLRSARAAGLKDPDENAAAAAYARAVLLTLTVDGDACALLNLPVEEMAVHINAGMRAAAENPAHHRVLLLIGALHAAPTDVGLLLEMDQEVELGHLLSTGGANDRVALELAAPAAVGDRQLVRLAEARSRVLYHMQRAVAGFEIATGFRWKLYLQVTSFLVSAALAAVAVAARAGSVTMTDAVSVVFSATVAGFLAPVARDLAVVLKRLRDGRA